MRSLMCLHLSLEGMHIKNKCLKNWLFKRKKRNKLSMNMPFARPPKSSSSSWILLQNQDIRFVKGAKFYRDCIVRIIFQILFGFFISTLHFVYEYMYYHITKAITIKISQRDEKTFLFSTISQYHHHQIKLLLLFEKMFALIKSRCT